MCVYSLIIDSKEDEWDRRYPWIKEPYTIPPTTTPIIPIPPYLPPPPTPAELDEFRRLLDRAREYDKRHNEPDCELDEKRQKLLDMAEKLGVKIDFL